MRWIVRIIETATKKVEHEIECSGERSAERVENGVNINLNHDNFHTVVVDTDKEAKDGAA